MQATDICNALLAASGNRALREPSRAPWGPVEALMGLGLRDASPQPATVWMPGPGGQGARSFASWLEARASPTARLLLVARPESASAAGPLLSALDPRGQSLLWLRDGAHGELLAPRAVPPPGDVASLCFEYLPLQGGQAPAVEQDVEGARAALATALREARDFCGRHPLAAWEKHFRRCLLRLSLEPQPLEDVSELLLLELPTPAIQLCAAALAADVFGGGMGAWNELSFSEPDDAEYQALSARLFSSVHGAFRAALNASAADVR